MVEGKPPRGTVELNHHFLILPSDEDGMSHGFKIVPVAKPENSSNDHFDSKSTPSPSSSTSTRSPSTPSSPYRPNMQLAELVDNLHLDESKDGLGSIAAGGVYDGRTSAVTAPIAKADGDIWYLAADSQEDKEEWVSFVKRSLSLIRRCDDTRPTLSGIGTIHDHYIIGRVLGVGRFGVVELETNISKQLCAIKIINKKKH